VPKWTDEEDERLRKLSDSGADVREMMADLGRPKNAVIGRCHRKGIRVNASKSRPPSRPRKTNKAKPPIPGLPAPVPMAATTRRLGDIDAQANETLVKTVDLQDHHCKYPHGNPGEPTFGHCGSKRIPGLPYCETHAAICFVSREEVDRQRREYLKKQEEAVRGAQYRRVSEDA